MADTDHDALMKTAVAFAGGGPDAVFREWQHRSSGEPLALYNITAPGHPSFGSTVIEMSLRRMNLEIPQTPPPR